MQLPREVRRLRAEGYVNAVTWSFDGSRLAALSNFGGIVTIWDPNSWSVVKEFKRDGGAYSQNSFAFLPDGTLLITTAGGRSPDPRCPTPTISSLTQWDSDTGQPVRHIPDLGCPPKSPSVPIGPTDTFALSADGSLIAGISGGGVILFETHGWSIVRRFATPATPKHPDFAASVAISPDARQIAVGTGFGHVHIFAVDGSAAPFSFVAFDGDFAPGCNAITFRPDGHFLATGRGLVSAGASDDGWTRIWRVSDGAMVANLTGGAGSVRSAAWNPNGNMFVVADDRTLRLWQSSELPEAPRLITKVSNRSYSVQFSPSGILAASDGTEIAIYR